MAVSDAAMLAPEEVFSGKGDIKEQTELTQAERKRRRANKKRKFKGQKTRFQPFSSSFFCYLFSIEDKLIYIVYCSKMINLLSR